MKLVQITLSVVLLALSSNVYSQDIKRAFLDRNHNVHIIDYSGSQHQLTHAGNARSLKLAANNAVAWLVMNDWVADGDDVPQSQELKIYLKGKTRSIKCGMFIRDHWFWQDGDQIAIDCGGRHFAGWEYLYDIKTLTIIASFDQADVPLEKRPAWSDGE